MKRSVARRKALSLAAAAALATAGAGAAHAALLASRAWGLAHLDELAQQAAGVTGVAEPACLEYLSGLDYGLSYKHLEGLTSFLRRLSAPGMVPNGALAFLAVA